MKNFATVAIYRQRYNWIFGEERTKPTMVSSWALIQTFSDERAELEVVATDPVLCTEVVTVYSGAGIGCQVDKDIGDVFRVVQF